MYRPLQPNRKPRSKIEAVIVVLLVGTMGTFIGLNCGPLFAWLVRTFRELWTFTQ